MHIVIECRWFKLSDSCLHSTMDASQIRGGPLNLCRRLGFFIILVFHIDVEARAYGRAASMRLAAVCFLANRSNHK